MRTLAYILLTLGFAGALQANPLILLAASQHSSGVTYMFTETFEGSQVDDRPVAGYDNTGWSNTSGSNVPHDTTSPSPLTGTYSFRTASNGQFNRAFTAAGELHVRAKIQLISLVANSPFIEARGSSNSTTLSYVETRNTNTCRTSSGGVNGTAASASSLVPGNTYWVWFDYYKGTGANGVTEFRISATPTRPGSATCTVTNGAATANADGIRFSGPDVMVIDDIVIDTAQVIGDA